MDKKRLEKVKKKKNMSELNMKQNNWLRNKDKNWREKK